MSKLRLVNKSDRNTDKESNLSPTKNPTSMNEEIANLNRFLSKESSTFSKSDIDSFKNSSNYVLEILKKVTEKLFEIASATELTNETMNEDSNSDALELISLLPESFQSLETLLLEILEDDLSNKNFIEILVGSLNDIDHEIQKKDLDIELVYNLLSKLLESLQEYNLTQQKYIYAKIASSLNDMVTGYKFISPESGGHVDTSVHKVVTGKGQRIERGLSYILLSDENEVLKFGNIKVN